MHRGSAHSLFHGSHLRVSRLCFEVWQLYAGFGRTQRNICKRSVDVSSPTPLFTF